MMMMECCGVSVNVLVGPAASSQSRWRPRRHVVTLDNLLTHLPCRCPCLPTACRCNRQPVNHASVTETTHWPALDLIM